jgi:hypothetical protein
VGRIFWNSMQWAQAIARPLPFNDLHSRGEAVPKQLLVPLFFFRWLWILYGCVTLFIKQSESLFLGHRPTIYLIRGRMVSSWEQQYQFISKWVCCCISISTWCDDYINNLSIIVQEET